MAYAYTEIDAPEAGQVALKFGSDDGIRIWCNGALAADYHLHRALTPDENLAVSVPRYGRHFWLRVDELSEPRGISRPESSRAARPCGAATTT